MGELKKRITENGIDYILAGDYYIPDLKLPEENRPIGYFGRLHRDYLKQEHSARYTALLLTCELWTYLADLNEQAEKRLDIIMEQMKIVEGVTEELKAKNQWEWVQKMNSIRYRAEEERAKCQKVTDAFAELYEMEKIVVLDAGRYGFVELKYYKPPHGFEEDATFTDGRALFDALWQEWFDTTLYLTAKKMQLDNIIYEEVFNCLSKEK
ncbi:TnpV protein [bacterium 1xD42-87]|nr:TnpV protein [bacterium 1xD42-87]